MAEAWQDYFESGEKLIWEGVPKKGGWIGAGSIAMAIFGLPFLAAGLATTGGGLLGILGIANDLASGFGGLFVFLFGLPFLAVGAGLVFGPFYVRSYGHKKVRYALSTRRAYIASTWWGRKMEILPISENSFIEVEHGQSILFHTETGIDSDGDRTTKRKGFHNIENVMHVYKLIRKIQAGDYERFR